MSAEWVTALATCIGVGTGIIALSFTGWQIFQLKNQIKLSNLTNVLSIESEINDRKENLDKINQEIINNNGRKKINHESLKCSLEAAVENWINAVDRLCFCIRKNYFPEKEWIIEYRDYIINLVRENEKLFGPGSRYIHIIKLNDKWKQR